MSIETLTCGKCGKQIVVPDGTPRQVAAYLLGAGWTTPSPFSDDICSECSRGANQ